MGGSNQPPSPPARVNNTQGGNEEPESVVGQPTIKASEEARRAIEKEKQQFSALVTDGGALCCQMDC